LNIPRVAASSLTVELRDFVRIPASASSQPLARINFLFHAGDGSGRLFVSDMRGKIYVIRNGAVLAMPFLNVAAAPHFLSDGAGNSEVGLLGFAFHPDFNRLNRPGHGKFYTLHSAASRLPADPRIPLFKGPKSSPDHFNVLSEWSADAKNPDRIDPASRREILRLAVHSNDHGGGQLGFNPNASPQDPEYGLLYIAVGDGGNTVWDNGAVDKYRQAQNMTSAFGKILRINPLPQGARTYSVPASNPFVGRNDVLPEIWVSGLRNPERFSWDRGGDHKMLIADIGQAGVEEINLGKPGANYGWGSYEGDFIVDRQNEKKLTPVPRGKPPAGFLFPVAVYGHADGIAITGGFVYRGKLIPELAGKYIFGDLDKGALFYADAQSLEAGKRTPVSRLKLFYRGAQAENLAEGVLKAVRADLRLGLGEDGEIYILTKTDGAVRQLIRHR
jgi:glucose/arabinose dehydrogenase